MTRDFSSVSMRESSQGGNDKRLHECQHERELSGREWQETSGVSAWERALKIHPNLSLSFLTIFLRWRDIFVYSVRFPYRHSDILLTVLNFPTATVTFCWQCMTAHTNIFVDSAWLPTLTSLLTVQDFPTANTNIFVQDFPTAHTNIFVDSADFPTALTIIFVDSAGFPYRHMCYPKANNVNARCFLWLGYVEKHDANKSFPVQSWTSLRQQS